jgi:hypothetical protein
VVQVHAEIGPHVRIAVDRLDVELEVTDEIVLHKKRVGGFERRWNDEDAQPARPVRLLRSLAASLRR